MRLFRLILGISAITGLLFVPSCDDDDDDDEDGFVRFIQLSPDAPRVDLLLDGFGTDFDDIDFPEGTFYLELVEGDYELEVVPDGQGPSNSLLEVDVDIDRKTSQTLVAYDLVQSIKSLLLDEDTSDLPSGLFRFRVINVAQAIGEVDVYNVTDPNSPVLIYDDLGFGEVGNYIQIASGEYDLGIDENNDQTIDVTFSLPEIDAGTTNNIFFVNDDDGDEKLVLQADNSLVTELDPD